MVYSLDEIKKRIKPVAEKYSLRAVYLFGSYARNEATEESDVDIMIDRTGSTIKGLFDMSSLYDDLSDSMEKEIDLITTHTLEQQDTLARSPLFAKNVIEGRVLVYGE